MSTNPRHRGTSRGRWLPVIVAGLLGGALGAGGLALVTSAASSPTPPAAPPQAAAPVAPPQAAASITPTPQPAETERSVEPVTFAEPATDASGMSLTVLTPERIKHGIRLTIALANTTDAPIVVDTAELGPHDQSFDGAPVPMTTTPAKKKIMPGEGYTYQVVILPPTTNVGPLKLRLGTVTVAGQAQCGTLLVR